MFIPTDVQSIIDTFHNNGFEAFIVGGCVRDSILGKAPNDYDITTDALPNDIINLFDKTIPTGIQHGTITVILNKNNYEVTTYRIDGEYLNNRKPENVVFVSNIKEDLSRRDFTINAMAFNNYTGLKDYFNGMGDLNNKIIRCVGEPDKRFTEDSLRMLRAIRFSCKLDFNIEQNTYTSIIKNHKLISNISIERIRDELIKILICDRPSKGLSILKTTGMLNLILPEITSYDSFTFNTILKALDASNNILHSRLAILLLPISNSNLLFNKESFSTLNEKTILKHLRFDNCTIENTCNLCCNFSKISDMVSLYSIKKLINSVSKNLIFDLIDIHENLIDTTKISRLTDISKDITFIINNNIPVSIKDLSITGSDLIKEFNLKPSKLIGETLNLLLDKVLQNSNLNSKETLLSLAKSQLNK